MSTASPKKSIHPALVLAALVSLAWLAAGALLVSAYQALEAFAS